MNVVYAQRYGALLLSHKHMEPKFQTSFIPKAPIPSGNSSLGSSPRVSLNILSTLALILFVGSILASGGVFAYNYYLKSQIEASNMALSEARKAFESPENEKILLISDQLKSIRTLLTEHKVVSPVFELFEKETLPTVRFTSFTFTRDSQGHVVVTIIGEAQSYVAWAQQAKIFLESDMFEDVTFSKVVLSDKGAVQTTIKAILNPDVVLYSNKIQTVSMISKYTL